MLQKTKNCIFVKKSNFAVFVTENTILGFMLLCFSKNVVAFSCFSELAQHLWWIRLRWVLRLLAHLPNCFQYPLHTHIIWKIGIKFNWWQDVSNKKKWIDRYTVGNSKERKYWLCLKKITKPANIILKIKWKLKLGKQTYILLRFPLFENFIVRSWELQGGCVCVCVCVRILKLILSSVI